MCIDRAYDFIQSATITTFKFVELAYWLIWKNNAYFVSWPYEKIQLQKLFMELRKW